MQDISQIRRCICIPVISRRLEGDSVVVSDPTNNSPVATAASFSVNEDAVLSDSISSNASDVDGDTLTFSVQANPSNGVLSLQSDGDFTYTPNANFNGSDQFTYRVSDGRGGFDTADVTITVNAVNDAPVAVDDSFIVNEDTQLVGTVATNDSDVDLDSLTYSLVSDVSNGTLVLSSNGSFTYDPDLNFNGSDQFTYQVSDGTLTDTATASITVVSVNDPPTVSTVIPDQSDSDEDVISLNVAGNFADVDTGDTLTFSATGLPTGLSISSAGLITGTIASGANTSSPFSVTVTAQDSSGATVDDMFSWVVAAVSGTEAFEGIAAARTALSLPSDEPPTQAIAVNHDGDLVTNPTFNAKKTEAVDYSTDATRENQQPGRCIHHDGSNDISVASSSLPNNTSQISFSYLMRFDKDAGDIHGPVISSRESASPFEGFMFWVGSDEVIDLNVEGETLSQLSTGIGDNTWKRITVTIDGVTGKIYVDGTLLVTHTFSAALDCISNTDFQVGKFSSSHWGKGSIADLRVDVGTIWTDDERSFVESYGATGTDPTLTDRFGWWKFDESKGTKAYDSSGNGNDITHSNITEATFHAEDSTVPYSYQDEIGFSSGFGTDDHLTDGSESLLEVEFWMKTTDVEFVVFADETHNDRTMLIGRQASSSGGTFNMTNNGSPTILIDDVAFTGHRGEFYTAVADGNWHKIKVSNWDVSTWDNQIPIIGGYSSTGFDYDDGIFNVTINGVLQDGPIRVPRDESDVTKNVLGSSLQHTGRVRRNALLKQSHALNFDGVNDLVDLASHRNEYSSDTEGTIVALIDPTDTAAPMVIMGASDSGDPSSEFRFYLNEGDDSKLRFAVRDGGTIQLNANGDTDLFALSGMIMVAVTMSSSGLSLYVNGVAETLTFNTGDASTQAWFDDVANIDAMKLGANEDSGGNQWFYKGLMAGVRYYDTTLSAAEILALYEGTEPDNTLISHWAMSESGTSVTVHDTIGTHHGTLTGFTVADAWGTKQDRFHHNNTVGYTKYTHATLDPIYIPYRSDGTPVASPTVPSGYTKDADYPADDKHNGAETVWDFTGGVESSFKGNTPGIETDYHPSTSDRPANKRYASSDDSEHFYAFSE